MTHQLDAIFKPRSIAVVGATDRDLSINKALLTNLVFGNFQGPVYPVNAKREVVHCIPAYPSVDAIPGPVDLAVLMVPVEQVPEVVEACGRKGVRGLVIITAGFREIGPEGAAREQRLVEQCAKYGMRFIGPNCFGVINNSPDVRLNATFSANPPTPGRVAFMSQSGALGEILLDKANQLGLGVARFASLGNKTDVSAMHLLEYWEDDPDVDLFLLYIESIGHARRFAEQARRIIAKKPLVTLKAGSSVRGAIAASSHTGALGNEERANEALFRQFGVTMAHNLEQLFQIGYALTRQPLPSGAGVGIVTNAGGPGILATDACTTAGLEVPELDAEIQGRLRAALRSECSAHNPIDVIASGGHEEYRLAMDAVMADPALHSIIVCFVPTIALDAYLVAEVIREYSDRGEKPIHVVWLTRGHIRGAEAVALLKEGGVPLYEFPFQVAEVIEAARAYGEWRDRVSLETPTCPVEPAARERVQAVLSRVRAEDRHELVDAEAQEVLGAYGIPFASTRLVSSPAEALRAAQELGYPVALKASAPGLLHKTDVGGVVLGIADADALAEACAEVAANVQRAKPEVRPRFLVQPMVEGGHELVLGVRLLPAYGHLIMFGLGGIFVELLQAVTFGIAPLTPGDARDMIESSPASKILEGYRGAAGGDVDALVDTLCRLSWLVFENPEIAEVDINPFRAFDDASRNAALDQVVVLTR